MIKAFFAATLLVVLLSAGFSSVASANEPKHADEIAPRVPSILQQSPSQDPEIVQRIEARQERFIKALQEVQNYHDDLAKALPLKNLATAVEETNTLNRAFQRIAQEGPSPWREEDCNALPIPVEQFQDARGNNRVGKKSAQLETVLILQLAMSCNDNTELGTLALYSISQALPDMRQNGMERRLIHTLSDFAHTPKRAAFTAGELGYMAPLFEALFTIVDPASVERIAQMQIDTRHASDATRLPHYLQVAQNAPQVRLQINPPANCVPTLNGQALKGKSVNLRIGAHLLGCGPSDASVRRFSQSSTMLFESN